MAKGQVTEEDLSAGLKSIGSLGTLTSSGGRRDSPFGKDFAKTPSPEALQVKEITLAPTNNTAELKAREPSPVATQLASKPKVIPERKAVAVKESREEGQRVEESKRKADILTERITLQMRSEMRDDLNDLARKLQRKKTDKSERITANSVMRVAIQSFLESFELKDSLAPNTEEELLQAVTKRK